MSDVPPSPQFVDDALKTWLPGAMFVSEVLWLEKCIRAAEADLVLECGRQDGLSTWMLGTLLQHSGVKILSIDFDDDERVAARARERVEGLPVTCVSGDIHIEVPRLLRAQPDRRVAVVQDGPKGWEGMATVLAAAQEPNVVLVAQHNLHRGHITRTVFQMLALHPAFLEAARPDDVRLKAIREQEVRFLLQSSNRAVDHTSLGVIVLTDESRAHLSEALGILRPVMAPWDPIRVRHHWDKGDFAYCARLRQRARYTLARFKKR